MFWRTPSYEIWLSPPIPYPELTLKYTDPSGMYVFGSSVSETQQGQFNAALDKAREDLKKYGQLYGTDSDTYKKAQKALEAYGEKGVDNGVTINAAETIDKGSSGGVNPKIGTTAVTPENPNGQKIDVAFTNAVFGSETFGSLIGHEGAHVSDASAWVKSGFAPSMNPTWYQTEMDGYAVQGLLSQASDPNRNASIWDPGYGGKKGPMRLPGAVYLYKTSWEQADIARLRATNVKNYLANPVDQNGSYELTPNKTPKAFVRSRSKR